MSKAASIVANEKMKAVEDRAREIIKDITIEKFLSVKGLFFEADIDVNVLYEQSSKHMTRSIKDETGELFIFDDSTSILFDFKRSKFRVLNELDTEKILEQIEGECDD